MLATIIEVLDTSVANVSLPYIAGNLSASTDEATWVLTSYLLSNAIILPATNWLGQVFGRKRFLIGCIALFTIASALCGIAGSLGFLIMARVIQGAAGGALQPISQAVLMESFPPAKRGMAMAVFTMGIVVAPILGPIIGGRLHWVSRARIGHGASDCRSSHSQEPQFCHRECPDVADWRASLRHNRDSAAVHAEFIALHRARGWYGYDPSRYRRVHCDDHCRSHCGTHQQPCSDHP